MMVTWFIIYYYLKQQLMKEFNLDKDLIKIKNTKSPSAASKSVTKQFRHTQKKELNKITDTSEHCVAENH